MKLSPSITWEVIFADSYAVIDRPKKYDTIIDIGANQGIFSLQAQILNPKAHIYALEPNPHALGTLKELTQTLRIKITEKAIGDGQDQYLRPTGNPARASVHVEPKFGGPIKVQTIPFPELFQQIYTHRNGETRNPEHILLKCDCEGGEHYLIGHEDLLRQCDHIAMEVHYKGYYANIHPKQFWKDWIKQFKQDYKIETKLGGSIGRVIMLKR